MNNLVRYYKFLQLISIDVAIGSVILSISIAHVLGVWVPWQVFLALYLSVWMIYTFDHLLDARKVNGMPSMDRHVFHKENGLMLFYILLVTAMSSLSLLFFIPSQILLFGAITAGVVGGYFILTWWLKVFVAKELLIAILYGIGVCLAPFALSEELSYLNIIILLEVILLAFTNLLLFSYFEEKNDRRDGYHSWVTIFGASRTVVYIRCVFIIGVLTALTSGFLFMEHPSILVFQGLLLVMWAMLIMIFSFKNHLVENERYRFFGDIIFMLPGLVLAV